jgi:oligogalacturonide lyase
MSRGQVWPAEWQELTDPISGIRIWQLTNYKAHSYHLYFTNSGWYADGKKLLFASDRGNRTNLYGLDLAEKTILQLTDLEPLVWPGESHLLGASINPQREEAYFWVNQVLLALDLETLDLRELYRAPKNFSVEITSVTADGRYICTGLYEDLSRQFRVDLEHGYVGFREYWKAKPLSQVLRIEVATGKAEVAWEERYWIGHINTSPTLPNILTFCHEGPWEEVDCRIWGLDLMTGKAWKIRPPQAGEAVGHEYWFADGVHIGFHGRRGGHEKGEPFYGCIRYDNTEHVEIPFPYRSTHFHSLSLNLIVGDGNAQTPYLLLWRFRDGQLEGPRILARHGGSFHVQILHVHPRFSPDGQQVLYTCDPNGYGNVFLVDVPEFTTLPLLDERGQTF